MLERRRVSTRWHRKVLKQENIVGNLIITEIRKKNFSSSNISRLIGDLNKIEHKILNLMPKQSSAINPQVKHSLGNEAEELRRKQLAIEKEIRLLKAQQQQKAFYVRSIPNKPPPPYRPSPLKATQKSPSVIPASKEEIVQITEYSAKILHKAWLSKNLDNVSISDNILNLIGKNINKGCYKYVFDLCKEIAKDHYGQFTEPGPSWMNVTTKSLIVNKPLDVNGLNKLMSKKLLQTFGFERNQSNKPKKKPLEEILKQEMQAEESTWINYDKDEALIKDKVVNQLMEMLLKESAVVLKQAIEKKQEKLSL